LRFHAATLAFGSFQRCTELAKSCAFLAQPSARIERFPIFRARDVDDEQFSLNQTQTVTSDDSIPRSFLTAERRSNYGLLYCAWYVDNGWALRSPARLAVAETLSANCT
jgi:hypothetical protein